MDQEYVMNLFCCFLQLISVLQAISLVLMYWFCRQNNTVS